MFSDSLFDNLLDTFRGGNILFGLFLSSLYISVYWINMKKHFVKSNTTVTSYIKH